MKEGQASRTADIAIAYRAAEAKKPKDERVCDDPFAVEFLSGVFRVLLNSALLTRIALRYAQRVGPGSHGWTIGRHRYIDDCLKGCIEDGIEQLVILGAGYDSRAYRIDELRGKVRVFEVDHPDTQKAKKEKLEKILGSLPDHVVYVPVNFDTEDLAERLSESGYDGNLATLFIWEAVTMYLTADAVDDTLAFVASNSGAGSSVVFDYIYRSVLDGTCELKGARGFVRQVEKRGDPVAFGIEEGTVEEFLSERGFHQVRSVTADFVKSAYFRGASRSIEVAPFLGYVHARVKPQGEA